MLEKWGWRVMWGPWGDKGHFLCLRNVRLGWVAVTETQQMNVRIRLRRVAKVQVFGSIPNGQSDGGWKSA